MSWRSVDERPYVCSSRNASEVCGYNAVAILACLLLAFINIIMDIRSHINSLLLCTCTHFALSAIYNAGIVSCCKLATTLRCIRDLVIIQVLDDAMICI